ncbi:MAG: hypothetical protein JXQ73_19370 [Phycisphaerae bacterium]|nr:hypothetical protein [Phycisphaerae bacterium]
MTTVELAPGICNLNTTITAQTAPGETVEVTLRSDCPNWSKVADDIQPVDPITELFRPFPEIGVVQLMDRIPHKSCPMVSAILKAIEIEARLALPADVTMRVTKT